MSIGDLLFVPKDAKSAIDKLVGLGYDTAAIYRYACAARSWTKRDSDEWKVWREVEKQTSSPQSES